MQKQIQRREFLKLASALALSGFIPPALAATLKQDFTIYGAPALPSLTIATAVLQGQLAKKTDFSLKIWRNPDQLRAGVASGKFKVMMSPSNVGVNLRNQGQQVGMVNILTGGINNLLSKKPLSEMGDLQGKKLIMPFKHDMPDIVFQALLKKMKVDLNKISIHYAATPPEAMMLFLTKDYDACFVPEPLASACILKGKKLGVNVVRNFKITELWQEAFNTQKPIMPLAGIISNVDFYQQHQGQFELLHQDLTNALQWIENNPQSAAEIGTNYFPAPLPAIANAIPYSNLIVMKGSEIKEDIMQFLEIIMRHNPKLLGGELPNDDYFLC